MIPQLADTLNSEGHWRGELHNRRKDGSHFYTRAAFSSVEFEGASCWLAVHEGITACKQFEQDLANNERSFHTLSTSMPSNCSATVSLNPSHVSLPAQPDGLMTTDISASIINT